MYGCFVATQTKRNMKTNKKQMRAPRKAARPSRGAAAKAKRTTPAAKPISRAKHGRAEFGATQKQRVIDAIGAGAADTAAIQAKTGLPGKVVNPILSNLRRERIVAGYGDGIHLLRPKEHKRPKAQKVAA